MAFSICLGGTITACSTTQEKAARLKVSSNRTLADHLPINVTTPAPGVNVLNTAVIQGTAGTAIAVTLENTNADPVNDLPLQLDGRVGGKVVDINGAKPSSYVNAHAPALAPGEKGTWVYTSPRRKVPVTGAVTAKVGVPADPPITTADEVPTLDVSPVTTTPAPKGAIATAEVTNPTDFPQVNVAVYAWALQGNRYVSAGQAIIDLIDPGKTETATVRMIGDPGAAQVQMFAPATIFK